MTSGGGSVNHHIGGDVGNDCDGRLEVGDVHRDRRNALRKKLYPPVEGAGPAGCMHRPPLVMEQASHRRSDEPEAPGHQDAHPQIRAGSGRRAAPIRRGG
jgi:hypothetical protein